MVTPLLRGNFLTAKAKIYPKEMNLAIAFSISRFLSERLMSTGSTNLPECLEELNSNAFVDESVVQPDFHMTAD